MGSLLKKVLFIIIAAIISCSPKEENKEFIGLWVADFDKNYIKLTDSKYYIKFDFAGKSREIFGQVIKSDTVSNVIEIKYNKIFDNQEEIKNFAADEIKYFRYEIDEKIMLFNISSDINNSNKLEGFFIKEPYE